MGGERLHWIMRQGRITKGAKLCSTDCRRAECGLLRRCATGRASTDRARAHREANAERRTCLDIAHSLSEPSPTFLAFADAQVLLSRAATCERVICSPRPHVQKATRVQARFAKWSRTTLEARCELASCPGSKSRRARTQRLPSSGIRSTTSVQGSYCTANRLLA